jgi:hypothetical protein
MQNTRPIRIRENKQGKQPNALGRIRLWPLIIVFLCFIMGLALIISEFQLIPIILKSIKASSEPKLQPAELSGLSSSQGMSNREDFKAYLPYLISNEGEGDKSGVQGKELDKIFGGIDFSSGSPQVTLDLIPNDELGSTNQPVKVSFFPGEHCAFGEGIACTYVFPSSRDPKVVFVSVHSGIGGDADSLRDLVEGTNFNQGKYSSNEVQHRIEMLVGSKINLSQGEEAVQGLTLLSIIRVPPENINEYRQLPVEYTLDYAAGLTSLDQSFFDQDLLVIETCGWRLPDDMEVEGWANTSYSVYLALIGLVTN